LRRLTNPSSNGQRPQLADPADEPRDRPAFLSYPVSTDQAAIANGRTLPSTHPGHADARWLDQPPAHHGKTIPGGLDPAPAAPTGDPGAEPDGSINTLFTMSKNLGAPPRGGRRIPLLPDRDGL